MHYIYCEFYFQGSCASLFSPTVKEVDDHYIGVSDDSGNAKERRFVNYRFHGFLILYESK